MNLNFTDLVSSKYVRHDLRDVEVEEAIDVWTNFTAGSYLVVNTTNVTTSFTVNFGNYIGNNTYSNHTKSDNTTAITGYSEENGYYVFSFYDEEDATSYLPSGTNNTMLLTCSDGTSSFSVNDTKVLVATTDTLEEARMRIEYSAGSFYYRGVLPDSSVEFRNIYLVDATQTQVVQTIIYKNDYTGDFDDAELIIKKNLEDSLVIITETDFDAEDKAIIYLINGDKYTVTISNGDEERTIGYLYADSTDLTKTLTVGNVNYTNILAGNVSLNLTFGSIELRYYDPTEKTLNVSIWVYNVSTNNLLYSATSSNTTRIQFLYEVPDENATYKVRYEINHQDTGIWGGTFFLSGTGNRTIPNTEFPITQLADSLGGNSSLWVMILFILPIPMLFSRKLAPLGAIFMLGAAGVLNFWGTITIHPTIFAVGSGVVLLLLIRLVKDNER